MQIYEPAGDVAFRVLESINSVSRRAVQDGLSEMEEETQIYICDINPNMLNVGKKRAIERGIYLTLMLLFQLCSEDLMPFFW